MTDTVFDGDYSGPPERSVTGTSSAVPTTGAIESALGRAIPLWPARPREFRQLVAIYVGADYSWARPGLPGYL